MENEITINGVVYVKKTDKTSAGYCSTGDRSTGNCSTGNWSTGDRSTGNFSTGYCSTGNWSTGYCSTGDRSTGDFSTGDRSTGNWSTGYRSTGHFETKKRNLRAFNKKVDEKLWNEAPKPACLYFTITEWVNESDMTEEEKDKYTSYKATGGYLRVHDYKEAFTKSVVSATKEERDLIRALPNFDDDVFFEISGCDLRLLDK